MENYAGSQPACPPLRSQESNFPKKLSKTKSSRFRSAASIPLRADQASAFRGRAGPGRSLPCPHFPRPGGPCPTVSALPATEIPWGRRNFLGAFGP